MARKTIEALIIERDILDHLCTDNSTSQHALIRSDHVIRIVAQVLLNKGEAEVSQS